VAFESFLSSESIRIDLARKMTVAERFEGMCSLTNREVCHSKRTIAKANPGISQQEVTLIFIEIHHGKELADKVRKYLVERDS